MTDDPMVNSIFIARIEVAEMLTTNIILGVTVLTWVQVVCLILCPS